MSDLTARIQLHDGRTLVVDVDNPDEITEFVDRWQSGRKGGVDWVTKNGTVQFEYRDVVRVDFADGVPQQ